jgi:hypothetical protein
MSDPSNKEHDSIIGFHYRNISIENDGTFIEQRPRTIQIEIGQCSAWKSYAKYKNKKTPTPIIDHMTLRDDLEVQMHSNFNTILILISIPKT